MEDEKPPSALTRPPDDRDVAALARELNRLGARYLVIGGVAINRLGFIAPTQADDAGLEESNREEGRGSPGRKVYHARGVGSALPPWLIGLATRRYSLRRRSSSSLG